MRYITFIGMMMLLYSCGTSNNFAKRKYTKGIYIEKHCSASTSKIKYQNEGSSYRQEKQNAEDSEKATYRDNPYSHDKTNYNNQLNPVEKNESELEESLGLKSIESNSKDKIKEINHERRVKTFVPIGATFIGLSPIIVIISLFSGAGPTLGISLVVFAILLLITGITLLSLGMKSKNLIYSTDENKIKKRTERLNKVGLASYIMALIEIAILVALIVVLIGAVLNLFSGGLGVAYYILLYILIASVLTSFTLAIISYKKDEYSKARTALIISAIIIILLLIFFLFLLFG